MLKSKKKLIVISLGALLTLSLMIYGFNAAADNLTLSEKKARFDQLKNEILQERDELKKAELPTTETEIHERIQKSQRLKQKALEASKLAEEVEPPQDSLQKLTEDIFTSKSVLNDMKKGYSDNPKVLVNIERELKKLEQIEKDLKENNKSLAELRIDYEKARKNKVLE